MSGLVFGRHASATPVLLQHHLHRSSLWPELVLEHGEDWWKHIPCFSFAETRIAEAARWGMLTHCSDCGWWCHQRFQKQAKVYHPKPRYRESFHYELFARLTENNPEVPRYRVEARFVDAQPDFPLQEPPLQQRERARVFFHPVDLNEQAFPQLNVNAVEAVLRQEFVPEVAVNAQEPQDNPF